MQSTQRCPSAVKPRLLRSVKVQSLQPPLQQKTNTHTRTRGSGGGIRVSFPCLCLKGQFSVANKSSSKPLLVVYVCARVSLLVRFLELDVFTTREQGNAGSALKKKQNNTKPILATTTKAARVSSSSIRFVRVAPPVTETHATFRSAPWVSPILLAWARNT